MFVAGFLLLGAGFAIYQNANQPTVLADQDFSGFEEPIPEPIQPPEIDQDVIDPIINESKIKYEKAKENFALVQNTTIENNKYNQTELITLLKSYYLIEARYRSILYTLELKVNDISKQSVSGRPLSVLQDRANKIATIKENINATKSLLDEFTLQIQLILQPDNDIKNTSQSLISKSLSIKEFIKTVISLINEIEKQ